MQKYKSKLVGLGAALLTVLTLAVSSTSSDVVYATDTEPDVDTVTTTIGDRKIVEDMIKLDASKLDGANADPMASVVEGADGLMYVVANPEGELVYDENEVDYSQNLLDKIKTGNVGANDHTTGAIEVGIDNARQKEADEADTGVKDFDEVDYNNIEDLQSALNDDDFPFIEDEEYEKAIDEAESTTEQEEIYAQTPVFFASRILTMTQNFNDVPTVMKSSSAAIMAAASSSLSKPGTIYPPSGYEWVFFTHYGEKGKEFRYNIYYYTTINGTPSFCIEQGVPHGTTYTKSSTTSPITQTQLNNVAALIAAWHARGGWTNNEAGYKRYIGAQLAIWDWTNNKLGTVLITPNWKDGILENRETLKKIANSIKIAPTYDKTSTTVSKGSNAVFTVKRGATFRAAGKDHALGVSANNGATVSLSGTKITVNTSKVAAGKTVTVTVKKGYNQGAYNTPQVWNSGSKQKMATGRFVITQKLKVKVRAKGRVQVTKTDATSGAKLSGAKFRFSYSGTSREVTTNTNGVALLPVDLDEGTTVTVVETAAPAGYQLNSSSFTIKASNNPSSPTNTTRTNARSVGSLKVIKTGDLDGKRMQNAKFTIYRSDQKTVQTTVTTNSNGEAQVNNLPLGTYYAKETTAPVGYHLNTTMHKLTVTASTTSSAPATVTVSNAYIKPTVTKTVTDANESAKTSNTWTSATSDFLQYDLKTSVIRKSGQHNLSSLVITDNYDKDRLDVSKVEVFQGSTNVTSQFTTATNPSTGVITATAKSASLTNASFYDKDYTLRTTMKLKNAIRTGSSSAKAQISMSKSGSIAIKGTATASNSSNAVTTILPVATVTATHNLSTKNGSAYTKIATLNTAATKYYYGENYSASKIADGKYATSTTTYYYQYDTASGAATRTGTVTGNTNLNFEYVPITIGSPTKTVSDSDQSNVTSNTLEYGETFTYKVNHTLPSQLGSVKFGSYVITDTVSSNLDIVFKRIINSAGTDVTTKFTDGTSGNAVKYTAKAAELAKADFYGTTYTLEIKVKVKASALKTDDTKTELTFTNNATFVHDNVSNTTNTVTSKLPVYTLNYTHTLLKSNSKTDTIGTLKSGSDKYYRGQSYKYDKMADGRQTLNSVLYYFNFIPSFGNASYSGTATSNQNFDFYYLSIVVNTPTKTVTDSDQKDVTSNTLLYNETYTYNMKHTLQKELGTARFASYVLTDTIDSKLTIVSKRVINSAGTDVTSLFTDNSAGNTVKFTAKTAELAKASFYGTTYTVEIKVKVATSALKTDNSKEALTFTNSATFVHDNVTKTTNTVTSNLPVYTMTYGHSLLKTAKTSDLIGSMKSGSDKYYRGQSYKYDKMADGRQTLNSVLYYFNFIPSFGNASYSGTATSNQSFDFYYLSIIVNTPTKTVTDSDETNVTTNRIKAYEQFKYSVKHVVQQQLATAKFGTYVLQDTVDSRLTVVSSRILDGSGNNVTSLFDNKTSGNTVRYDAKAASLNTASFYNKTYNLEITVKVSDATLNAAGSGKRTFTMPNTGRLTHDGVVKNTGTTNTTLPAYRITINHKDVKTDAQLAQDIDYKYDGENYRYNPRTNLYDTDTPKNNYKSHTVHTGTINGRDITLETPYHIPVYTVNVDTIRIDTAKAGTGGALPVQLTLSEYKEYPDELDKIRYAITVTDTTNSNRVVYTRNMTVANFASTLNFTVPSNYLTKNSKVNYRVSIAPTANPEENDFNTQSGAVTTHGYTSSEKVLTNSDLLLNRIDYSAVIRTFKERTRSTVQEYKERIVYDFTPEERSKTGYGFDVNLDPTYTNELNQQATIDLSIVSPLAMIKGDTKNGIDSYLIDQYPAVGSTVTIPLERMSLANTTSAGTRRMAYDFELPHINIEPKTGILFTDEQVAAPHAAIQDPTAVMVDGGRLFYVPIWTDLGDYDIFVRSNATFGTNLIRINMNKDIDVYAYMYGTIDSDTIDDDELVVEPVYPDTEMPDDWDDDEKDWVLNP